MSLQLHKVLNQSIQQGLEGMNVECMKSMWWRKAQSPEKNTILGSVFCQEISKLGTLFLCS